MNTVIVDTNVIITANGKATHASLDCIERCQQRLEQIRPRSETSLVDDG